MRYKEIISESRSRSVIVVDVQPAYCNGNPDLRKICQKIIGFVDQQTGPVLMLVNAEDQGLTADTVQDIREFWQDRGFDSSNWSRVNVIDKGYGYLRSWMDLGVAPAVIIKTIRTMYAQRVNSSDLLWGGQSNPNYNQMMETELGIDLDSVYNDPIAINWISVAKLKQFSGSYIVGGARHECLREVELLMNAFNINYKRIDQLVYG
jgi:hypothetical protein